MTTETPPEGWVLRSYYSPAEGCYYVSRRTISDRVWNTMPIIPLYAPPGSPGNDDAAFVTEEAREFVWNPQKPEKKVAE